VRLCPSGGRQWWRGAGTHGGVLRGVAGLPVGVVPAPLRAALITAQARLANFEWLWSVFPINGPAVRVSASTPVLRTDELMS